MLRGHYIHRNTGRPSLLALCLLTIIGPNKSYGFAVIPYQIHSKISSVRMSGQSPISERIRKNSAVPDRPDLKQTKHLDRSETGSAWYINEDLLHLSGMTVTAPNDQKLARLLDDALLAHQISRWHSVSYYESRCCKVTLLGYDFRLSCDVNVDASELVEEAFKVTM